ncbi:MAG: choice-of-anchor J domain-containing protein [Bacteroidaceae bacterium]|nr:choice-of-anchor J domain-containing protein [Bacteroidaceae bacterium]
MKKTFRFLLAAVALLGIASCADVPELPYPTPDPNGEGGGTNAFSLPFTSASLNDFEVKTVEGVDWSLGSSYAKATGYANNVTTATKTWLVSPAINTTITSDDGVSIAFDNVLRYVKATTDLKGWHKVLASKDYAGDVTTATWIDLNFQPVESTTQSWDFYAAKPVYLPAELLNEEKVYIAFYFQCDGTNSTTWELKNFSMQEGMTPDPIPTPTDVTPVTIAEFNAAAVSTEVWYELVGTASGIKDGDQYGNFDLTDETGTVYVYGLLAAKDGEKKAFQDLVAKTGLANGDKIKIHGQRGDYQGKIEVLNAYFIEIVEKGGDTPGPGPGGEGDGSEKSPYNVAYVLGAGNPGTTAWVRGYIVGTVTDKSYDSAEFGTTNASNTNLLLADAADCTDASLCIPVQLPSGDVRDALSLQQHPENLGKQVWIYANLEKYFGQPGLKSASKYSWDGNSGGGEDPNPGGEGIFSADFTTGECGFTIYNVEMDENLSYVWAVDSKYGWKASAFKDNTRYPSDCYIVSSAIDLTSATSATLSFSHVARYFGDSATDFLSVLVTTSFDGDAAKASWVTLTVPSWPSGADWNYIDSGDISLAGYVGNKVYIAFRYTSSSSIAATWEIKSMSIK